MSWKDNRRRKRTWYRHYHGICHDLREALSMNGGRLTAEQLVEQLCFRLYERMRLHKKARIAESARASLSLAISDLGMSELLLSSSMYVPDASAGQDVPDEPRMVLRSDDSDVAPPF